jgi:hypothetical protein
MTSITSTCSLELRSLHQLASPQEAFLYRCSNCGDLRLNSIGLLDEASLQHLCPRRTRGLLLNSSGKFELIASGPYNLLIEWARSIALGLDDPLKGP